MWREQIVEVNYWPCEHGLKDFSLMGNTVGIILLIY